MIKLPSAKSLAIGLLTLFALQALPSFGQGRIRFMIGETEKNLDLAGSATGMPRTGEKAVIFRIGQWTVPEIEESFILEFNGPNERPAEIVLFSAKVSGDEVMGLEKSNPLPIKSGQRLAPARNVMPKGFFGESTGRPAMREVWVTTWDAKALPTGTREWLLSAKSYGLVAPRRDPVPEFDRLKGLILTDVMRAREAGKLAGADALVLFATGSKDCGSACTAETQVMIFLMKPTE